MEWAPATRGFVAEGADVVIADILEQEGRALADELGAHAIFSRLDVTSDMDWAETVAAAEDASGPVSVLINNARIVRFGPIEETEPAVSRQVIDINLTGSYLGIRAVVPSMREAGGGTIVNISSGAGFYRHGRRHALMAGLAETGSGLLLALGAQGELEKAVALNPKLPFAHYNLGVVYRRLGKPEQAAREFKLEMTLAPDQPWSYESLGTMYLQQRDMDRALEMFGVALKIDPKLPNSLDGVGKAYLERGEPQKAIAYFRRAVELAPDSAKMHFQLGQAYARTGRQEKGQEEIAKAQRLQARARKELEEAVSGKLPPPNVGGDER